jgi:protein-disulfide isomerase
MNKPVNNAGQSLGRPALVTSADHVYGPADAPVTIIEYSDFQCPACEMYHFVIEKLLASSTYPIRFVYRNFPLSQHANAIPSVLASEAADQQGKYWEMHKLIFDNHADWTELSDSNPVFLGYAAKIGLNIEKYKADIASSTLKSAITKEVADGVALGINSTPTFFINDKVIVNPPSYAEFKTIIDEAAKSNSN